MAIDSAELDAIVIQVNEHREGIPLRVLEAGLSLPRRTLQARLAALVREGRVERIGAGRGTRYRVPPSPVTASETGLEGISLDSAAEEVQGYVRRALTGRRPVGYDRSFLDGYRPNVSAYLDAQTSEELAALGARPEADRAAGTFARRILDRLLIDLSWNSSRLEGNTYSLLDTEKLLRTGRQAEGKAAFETQMILNHKAAIEFLIEAAAEIRFNRYTIQGLHALLADNLLGDPAAAGRLRRIAVRIEGSVFHPLETSQLIDEVFQQFLDTANAIADPFEQSFFTLVHLPYLQPFDDVNKRVSRLAANIPLIRGNLCPLSFLDVPTDLYIEAVLGVYELNRVELMRDVYLWAYRRSSERYSAVRRSLGDPDPFRLQYRDVLRDTVRQLIRTVLPLSQANDVIATVADDSVPANDQERFRQVVRTELGALHEGNIARYRVRPSEYEAWKRAQP